MPLADGVDFDRLSRHEMCGGNIKNAVYRAASAAALRDEGLHTLIDITFTDSRYMYVCMYSGEQCVSTKDLEESCVEELANTAERLDFQTLYI